MQTQLTTPETNAQRPPHVRTAPLAADLYETDEALLLVASLPGVRAEDLDIQLEGDRLTVTATRHIFDPSGAGDTFFGLQAPAGHYFTGFNMGYDGEVVPDVRLWFDDLGFITAVVPEPATMTLLSLCSLLTLRRRHKQDGKC